MESLTKNQAVKFLYKGGIQKPEIIQRICNRAGIEGSLRTFERKIEAVEHGIDIEIPNNANKGRPHALTEEDKMEIEDLLEENPCVNSAQIVHQANLNCTPRTVRNYLKEQGYKWKPVKPTFQLEPKHFPARARFAKNHLEDTWQGTLFLDESTFRLHTSATHSYQKPGQRVSHPKPKYCDKVNVCAAISFQGPTRLWTFDDNMDAELFQKILINSILPDCRALYGRGFRLAWDQDSKHTSKLVKTSLMQDMYLGLRTGLHRPPI